MVSSPNELKILKWDEKPQSNKQKHVIHMYMYMSMNILFCVICNRGMHVNYLLA